jgi:hypothetical protein
MRYAVAFVVGLVLSAFLLLSLLALRSYLDARMQNWLDKDVELAASEELMFLIATMLSNYGYLLVVPLMAICFVVAGLRKGQD